MLGANRHAPCARTNPTTTEVFQEEPRTCFSHFILFDCQDISSELTGQQTWPILNSRFCQRSAKDEYIQLNEELLHHVSVSKSSVDGVIMAFLLLLSLASLVSAAPKTHHHLHQSLIRQVDTTSVPSFAIDYGMVSGPQMHSPP